MVTENMRRLMAMGAVVMAAIDEMPPSRPYRWKDDEHKKATKDRSIIKAARKQNRSRK